ncbi:MAG: M20/M25/M40 family metallo-hydrolase [bacterium]|nr:M20/M25/M40 family metallo-hydrolase [bacterium]
MLIRSTIGLIVLLATSQGSLSLLAQELEPISADLRLGLEKIEGNNILRHVKTLASDKFEGRAPGTRGEELTVKYVAEQFKAAGAEPGNPNGTYLQNVPLVGFLTTPRIDLAVSGIPIPFEFQEDFVHDYPRLTRSLEIKSSEVVFAGYGITAEQYSWDDYKGVDVKGKLVLVLSGEPSRPIEGDTQPDPAFFKGVVRTYYATRDAKYEEARRRGAAGILVIYDPEKANTYSLFQTFAKLEGQNLKPRAGSYELAIAGLVTTKAAIRIFAASNRDLSTAEKSAQLPDFQPVTLAAKAAINLRSQLRSINSRNVVAKVNGSDPRLRNEYVIYTAHWDHLGKDISLTGDQIYNGANDNAIGTSQLIEAARAFAALKQKPARSILFIATTAEEKGFLGARYYLQNPLYSASVANINLDAGNLFGLTRDLGSTGYGNSTLDEVLEIAASMQGRIFAKESLDSTGGLYFGSDQIEFAKAGIPAVFPWSGVDYVGKSKDFGENVWEEYSAKRYHKVTDGVMTDWDASGAVADTRWFVIAGFLIAEDNVRPKWKEGSEFIWISKRKKKS